MHLSHCFVLYSGRNWQHIVHLPYTVCDPDIALIYLHCKALHVSIRQLQLYFPNRESGVGAMVESMFTRIPGVAFPLKPRVARLGFENVWCCLVSNRMEVPSPGRKVMCDAPPNPDIFPTWHLLTFECTLHFVICSFRLQRMAIALHWWHTQNLHLPQIPKGRAKTLISDTRMGWVVMGAHKNKPYFGYCLKFKHKRFARILKIKTQ